MQDTYNTMNEDDEDLKPTEYFNILQRLYEEFQSLFWHNGYNC